MHVNWTGSQFKKKEFENLWFWTLSILPQKRCTRYTVKILKEKISQRSLDPAEKVQVVSISKWRRNASLVHPPLVMPVLILPVPEIGKWWEFNFLMRQTGSCKSVSLDIVLQCIFTTDENSWNHSFSPFNDFLENVKADVSRLMRHQRYKFRSWQRLTSLDETFHHIHRV